MDAGGIRASASFSNSTAPVWLSIRMASRATVSMAAANGAPNIMAAITTAPAARRRRCGTEWNTEFNVVIILRARCLKARPSGSL